MVLVSWGLRALFVLLIIAVTYLSVAPNPVGVKSGNILTVWLSEHILGDAGYSDKVAHFTAYFALAGVFVLARFSTGMRAFAGVVALGAYGGVLEIVQGGIVSRSMEGLDALANAAGALSGYPAAMALMAGWRILVGQRTGETSN